MFAVSISGCAESHAAMRGSVVMKVNPTTAHICTGKGEVGVNGSLHRQRPLVRRGRNAIKKSSVGFNDGPGRLCLLERRRGSIPRFHVQGDVLAHCALGREACRTERLLAENAGKAFDLTQHDAPVVALLRAVDGNVTWGRGACRRGAREPPSSPQASRRPLRGLQAPT